MTVTRPPIVRPSLPATIGDTHKRMRASEAAQTMPYWCGLSTFLWDAGTTKGWSPALNTDSVTYSYWVNDLGGDPAVNQFNTDPSVFVVPIAEGVVGDGSLYAVGIVGGGLFGWAVDVLVASAGGPNNAACQAVWDLQLPGGAPEITQASAPFVNQNTNALIPYDLVSFPKAAHLGMNGTFSLNGYNDPQADAAINPTSARYLKVIVYKGDGTSGEPGADFGVQVHVFVWRLTPVGNWGVTLE